MHVGRCPRQVPARHGPCRPVQVQVPRGDELALPLVDGHVLVHAGRQELRVAPDRPGRVADRLARGHPPRVRIGELEAAAVADGDHPQAVLRDAVVDRVEHAAVDRVAEAAQARQNRLEVPPAPVHHPAHVLEHPRARPYPPHGADERREPVARVADALLPAKDAERLARGPAHDDVRIGKVGAGRDGRVLAPAQQVAVVGLAAPGVRLDAVAPEPSRLEAERQPAAAGKEVEHGVLRPAGRHEHAVDPRHVVACGHGHRPCHAAGWGACLIAVCTVRALSALGRLGRQGRPRRDRDCGRRAPGLAQSTAPWPPSPCRVARGRAGAGRTPGAPRGARGGVASLHARCGPRGGGTPCIGRRGKRGRSRILSTRGHGGELPQPGARAPRMLRIRQAHGR